MGKFKRNEEVTRKQFEDAAKDILLREVRKENLEKRMPTRVELNQKWKLEGSAQGWELKKM